MGIVTYYEESVLKANLRSLICKKNLQQESCMHKGCKSLYWATIVYKKNINVPFFVVSVLNNKRKQFPINFIESIQV